MQNVMYKVCNCKRFWVVQKKNSEPFWLIHYLGFCLSESSPIEKIDIFATFLLRTTMHCSFGHVTKIYIGGHEVVSGSDCIRVDQLIDPKMYQLIE
jgi:hypothetical protein